MTRLVILAAALVLASCDSAQGGGAGSGPAACVPQAGMPATPSPSFRAFLGTRPTPADFRARYADMALIMPGDITTREMRYDCSRFFADTDIDGRIVGGRFG